MLKLAREMAANDGTDDLENIELRAKIESQKKTHEIFKTKVKKILEKRSAETMKWKDEAAKWKAESEGCNLSCNQLRTEKSQLRGQVRDLESSVEKLRVQLRSEQAEHQRYRREWFRADKMAKMLRVVADSCKEDYEQMKRNAETYGARATTCEKELSEYRALYAERVAQFQAGKKKLEEEVAKLKAQQRDDVSAAFMTRCQDDGSGVNNHHSQGSSTESGSAQVESTLRVLQRKSFAGDDDNSNHPMRKASDATEKVKELEAENTSLMEMVKQLKMVIETQADKIAHTKAWNDKIGSLSNELQMMLQGRDNDPVRTRQVRIVVERCASADLTNNVNHERPAPRRSRRRVPQQTQKAEVRPFLEEDRRAELEKLKVARKAKAVATSGRQFISPVSSPASNATTVYAPLQADRSPSTPCSSNAISDEDLFRPDPASKLRPSALFRTSMPPHVPSIEAEEMNTGNSSSGQPFHDEHKGDSGYPILIPSTTDEDSDFMDNTVSEDQTQRMKKKKRSIEVRRRIGRILESDSDEEPVVGKKLRSGKSVVSNKEREARCGPEEGTDD